MTDLKKLAERINAAIDRITSGDALMRIPVDQIDPDTVLADCLKLVKEVETCFEGFPSVSDGIFDAWREVKPIIAAVKAWYENTCIADIEDNAELYAAAKAYFTGALARHEEAAPQEGKAPELPARVLAMCKKRGWSLHWTARGAYLHLESSELIEAIRGKHGDPKAEAADVLLVLMSITESNGIPWSEVEAQAAATVERLEGAPRYEGEEYAAPQPAPQDGETKV